MNLRLVIQLELMSLDLQLLVLHVVTTVGYPMAIQLLFQRHVFPSLKLGHQPQLPLMGLR